MTTIDKEQVIEGWEHILEHGKLTLSPGMLELIHVTLSTLKDGSHPQSQKVTNTWTDMLTRGELPVGMRKQVQDTIILLRRTKP